MREDLVILGILYGISGLALLVALVWAMARPLLPARRLWPDRSALTRKGKIVEEVDRLIEQDNWSKSIELLRAAIYLEDGKLSPDAAEKANQHNLGILTRLLLISEKRKRRLVSLAVVEDLLLSRRDMQRTLAEAIAGRQSLSRKRGRDVPAWALDEYKRKISDLNDQLVTNRRSLESQFEKLFVELLEAHDPIEVPFH